MNEPTTAEVEISWGRFGPTFYCATCLAMMNDRDGFLIHPEEAGKRSRKPGFAYCPHLNKWFKRPLYRIPVIETASGKVEPSSNGFLSAGLVCLGVVLIVTLLVVVFNWLDGPDPFGLKEKAAPVSALKGQQSEIQALTPKDLGVAVTPYTKKVDTMKDGEDAWVFRVMSFSGKLYVNSRSDIETIPYWRKVHIEKVRGGFAIKEFSPDSVQEGEPGDERYYKGCEIIGRFQ